MWLYGFYLFFSVHIYVIKLRLTITQSLYAIIILIKQISPSSKIIIIFKTSIINVHPTFLNIYHYIINNDPVLSTAIRFVSFQRLLDALINNWNSQKLKSFYGPFQLIGFISILELQGMPMSTNPYLQS